MNNKKCSCLTFKGSKEIRHGKPNGRRKIRIAWRNIPKKQARPTIQNVLKYKIC